MRSDPSDNGGLFVGRRPGTAPIRFRALPEPGSEMRQRVDGWFAAVLLAGIVLMSAFCWSAIPLACLWIGSQVDYLSASVSLGLVVAFIAMLGLLFGTLAILIDLDRAWILVRRAAGYDQRAGALTRAFAATAVVCALTFVFWFLVIHGPGWSFGSGSGGFGSGYGK